MADTYPTNMVEVSARMYLYRWRPADWCAAHPDLPSFTLHALQVGGLGGRPAACCRLLCFAPCCCVLAERTVG